MSPDRDPVITGIGLVSCLGDGTTAHRDALARFRPVVDAERFAPYVIHPLAVPPFESQISRRDLRQMEQVQRTGTYAAGLALDQAGARGDKALCERMQLIVATSGGERDIALDEAILATAPEPDFQRMLNHRLMAGLRPTLFLAQLPNLLAGCISIVHGVVGSSRTFMGEEAAGADAVRIACARITAGQGDIVLVGGAQNAERPDLLLNFAAGGLLAHAPFAPVWARQAQRGGMAFGSLGCFLVIEGRAHAQARGAVPIAAITAISSERSRRRPGEAAATAARQLEAMRKLLDPNHVAVISAASGAAPATTEECAFLDDVGLPVRAVATALGHALEPAFPAAVALAALAVADARLFPPLEAAEAPMDTPLRHALVNLWGHARGEALALVSAP